jgi:CubicO group peptidase (beta-lactamase class C family)
VEKFLPEFRDIKVAVAKAEAPAGHVLVPTARPMTIHDLLTHRAGFIGIRPRRTPAEALRLKARQALPAEGTYTLEEAVKNLATSPLDAQPGAEFNYGSTASVVLGRVLEVVTGRTLDVVLRERIFEPLGMVDTGFSVPAEKHARVVSVYTRSPEKRLVRLPPDPLNPRYLSAGGGLFSTAADYLRFCQMLLNGGELDGRRILSRKTVELMTARHVETIPIPFLPGHSFGLGVAVRKADGDAGLIGSPGAYGWNGAYNTYFRIDPQEKLILLCFAQVEFSPRDLELHYGFHNTVMQAIVD